MQTIGGNKADRANSGKLQNAVNYFFGNRIVHVHNGKRFPALACAVELRSANIDACIAQGAGYMSQRSRQVLLTDDHAVEFARDMHIDTVDARELRRTTANGNATCHHFVAAAVDHTGLNRVGMRSFGNGIGLERKFQPLLLRQVEGIAYAQIVGVQPQHARNQGAVGPVSVIGMGERAKEGKRHFHRLTIEQVAHHAGNAQRTRRVRRGRPYHNGPHNIPDTHRLHVRTPCLAGRDELAHLRLSSSHVCS